MEIPKFHEAVITTAESYVGYQEYPGNNGFKDKAFDTKMRQVGFQNGWAWCSLFAELCWTLPIYDDKSKIIAYLTDNFSANAVRTFENFKNDRSGFFETTKTPVPGDIAIFEKRKNGESVKKDIWTVGHAAVVAPGITESNFNTIEGNSNSHGGREGIEVAALSYRSYNFYDKDGLCLIGFIHCKLD